MSSRTSPNLVASTVRGGLYTHVVGRRILYYPVLTSTMDEARRLAEEGADEGTVVIAERQSAGRGRHGRSWVSQPGNLLFSVIFRPGLEQLPFIDIIGGLAAARAGRKVARLAPRVKWPNDLMLAGRKAAGILAESAIEGDSVCYAVLGIGINVAVNPAGSEEVAALHPELVEGATSLNSAAGRDVSREDLLRQLLIELDDLYRRLPGGGRSQGNSPVPEWARLVDTIGQSVTVTWQSQTISGLAEGVDETGNLLLRTDDGQLVTLTAGDVTLGGATQS